MRVEETKKKLCNRNAHLKLFNESLQHAICDGNYHDFLKELLNIGSDEIFFLLLFSLFSLNNIHKFYATIAD